MAVHDVGSKKLEEGPSSTSFSGKVAQARSQAEFVNRDRRSLKCREERLPHRGGGQHCENVDLMSTRSVATGQTVHDPLQTPDEARSDQIT